MNKYLIVIEKTEAGYSALSSSISRDFDFPAMKCQNQLRKQPTAKWLRKHSMASAI